MKRKDGKYAQQTLWYKILPNLHSKNRSAGIFSKTVEIASIKIADAASLAAEQMRF